MRFPETASHEKAGRRVSIVEAVDIIQPLTLRLLSLRWVFNPNVQHQMKTEKHESFYSFALSGKANATSEVTEAPRCDGNRRR
jgi:hypothetical protein